MMRLTGLFFLVVILCTTVSGWIPISKAEFDQRQSAVAYLNNQYLVAFADGRDISPDSATSIYACRVTNHGGVLDPHGFIISGGSQDHLIPQVCSGSSDWLVIWQEGC
jgi:hypothetical protein